MNDSADNPSDAGQTVQAAVIDTAAETARKVAGGIATRIADTVGAEAERSVESGIQAGVEKAVNIIQTDEEIRAWQKTTTHQLEALAIQMEALLTRQPILPAVPSPPPLPELTVAEAVAPGLENLIKAPEVPAETLEIPTSPPVDGVPNVRVRRVQRWL